MNTVNDLTNGVLFFNWSNHARNRMNMSEKYNRVCL